MAVPHGIDRSGAAGGSGGGSLLSSLANLADPGASRILFWDDAAGELAFLTTSNGTGISGTAVSAKDFGAVGDGVTNDAVALQNALNYCASNLTGLYLPGRFACNAKLSVSSTRAFSVYGDGPEVSAIVFSAANSGLELIAAQSLTSGPWRVEDLGLYAQFAGCDGPGLKLGYTSASVGVSFGPVISNVAIQNDPHNAAAATEYWSHGLELVNARNTRILSPFIRGQSTGFNGNGILLTGSCTPTVIFAPQLYSWNKAITKGETAADDTEGPWIITPTLVNVNYGVYLDNTGTGGEPGVQITGGHINSRIRSVYGNKTNQILITKVLLYRNTDATGDFQDIYLENSTQVKVLDNEIITGGTSGTETAIQLVSVTDALVDGNACQQSRDVGVNVDAASRRVVVSKNNDFRQATTEAIRGEISGKLSEIFGGYSGATMPYGGYQFDGSTDYLDTNPLTGITDTKKGTWVGVVRFANAASAQEALLASTGDGFDIGRTSAGNLFVKGENAAGTQILRQDTANAPCAAAGTYIIMISFDLASAGSFRIYINNEPQNVTSTTFTDDTIDYTLTEYSIGALANGSGQFFTGDIYAMWFSELVALEFHKASVRSAFADENNVPVFMGRNGERPTGTAPILFHAYDPYTAWPRQRGRASSSWTERGTPGAVGTALQGQYGEVQDSVATVTADYAVGTTDHLIINNRAATNTLTLLVASENTGRELRILTIQAQSVISASSNVIPITGGAAGTAILPAVDGAWALLKSNGTNWQIVAS